MPSSRGSPTGRLYSRRAQQLRHGDAVAAPAERTPVLGPTDAAAVTPALPQLTPLVASAGLRESARANQPVEPVSRAAATPSTAGPGTKKRGRAPPSAAGRRGANDTSQRKLLDFFAAPPPPPATRQRTRSRSSGDAPAAT